MKRTRRIALLAILLALIVVLSFIPIQVSAATLALTLLPVLVIALTQDFVTALLGGLIMGVTSLVMAYTVGAATPTAPLFQNPLVSILPRLFVPVAAYAVMHGLRAIAVKILGKTHPDTPVSKPVQWAFDAVASLSAVITNTGLVLGMIWLLYGGKSVGNTLISPEFMTAMISINFVIEIIVFPLIAPPVVFAIRKQGGAAIPKNKREKNVAAVCGCEEFHREPDFDDKDKNTDNGQSREE
ncbi:MAG: hypothetical protein ACLUE6_04830 [Acutalibacteraceae bacterium]